jgi:hypothetical protein
VAACTAPGHGGLLVGLDVGEEDVRERQSTASRHMVDAQPPEAVAALGLEPADVVIAGEIVEPRAHLPRDARARRAGRA